MKNKRNFYQKRCAYCQKFFIPHPRVKDRQKSCKSITCRKKRKKESQKKWVESNPGYFKGRYDNTKTWRSANPDYQRKWRLKSREIQDELKDKSPTKTIRLVMPPQFFTGEIQDEIILTRYCGCGDFLVGAPIQDTSQDSLLPNE